MITAGVILVALVAPVQGQDTLDPAAKAAAAQAYLGIVCPLHLAQTSFLLPWEKRATKPKTARLLRQFKSDMRRFSAAYARAGLEVADYPWPRYLISDAQSLGKYFYELSSAFGRFTRGKTWEELADVTLWSTPYPDDEVKSLRFALGLPPAESANDGCPKNVKGWIEGY